MADSSSPTPAEIAILAGAGVTLIGSFLDCIANTSAWGTGAFPIVTLIPLYAVAIGAAVAILRWGNLDVPERVALGLTWRQLHLALGALAFVMALFWIIAAFHTGIGLWLMLLGTASCTVGAYMRMQEVPAEPPNSFVPEHGKVSPAGITLLSGAGVVLIGSFLAFEKISFGITGVATVNKSFSAWSGDLFFPVTIIPVLCGLVIGIHLAVATWANTSLPAHVSGFSWEQIYVVLGFQAALMMLMFLIQDKSSLDIGIGFWLMLLGSLALAVGATLHHREVARAGDLRFVRDRRRSPPSFRPLPWGSSRSARPRRRAPPSWPGPCPSNPR